MATAVIADVARDATAARVAGTRPGAADAEELAGDGELTALPEPAPVAESVAIASDALIVRWVGSSSRETRHLLPVLRANCLCEACRHAGTNQRLVDVASVPDDIAARSAVLEAKGGIVAVVWVTSSGTHESAYPAAWLFNHSHLKEAVVGGTIELWDSATMRDGRIPTVPYDDLMHR